MVVLSRQKRPKRAQDWAHLLVCGRAPALTVSTGIGKPMPTDAPDGEKIAVLTYENRRSGRAEQEAEYTTVTPHRRDSQYIIKRTVKWQREPAKGHHGKCWLNIGQEPGRRLRQRCRTPISRPDESSRGPPELPGLIEASV